jgi:hypothetical protein
MKVVRDLFLNRFKNSGLELAEPEIVVKKESQAFILTLNYLNSIKGCDDINNGLIVIRKCFLGETLMEKRKASS